MKSNTLTIHNIPYQICLTSILLLTSLGTHAGIVAEKTRVIFQQQQQKSQQQINLMLANSNDYAVILQTWIDQGAGDPQFSELPFLILPPVSKMQALAKQNLRIFYNGLPLPSDRESVYWLNLYEIPATKPHQQYENAVSLAMNTQLKLFYRPIGLKPLSIEDRAAGLSFQLRQQDQQCLIEVRNNTPYHASLINLRLSHAEQQIKALSQPDMMSYPLSSKRYYLEAALAPNTHYQLVFEILDDQGEIHIFKAPIQSK